MALITRCPDCATAFRVTPLQLQAQGGDVRCGHCAHIFNGFATLATMQEPEAVDLSARKVPDIPESNFETPSVDDSLIAADQEISSQATGNETTQTEAITESLPESLPREAPEPEPAASKEPALQISDPASAPGNYSAENYAPERYAPDDHAFDAAPSRKVSAAWGVASLFLLVVLAAQAIYFYRAELSAIAPATRPYLEQYCELLGCTIPLPQNGALLSIESSEMQAHTPRSGFITFNLNPVVGQGGVCGFWGVGQGATTRNGYSISRRCNAALRHKNRAIRPVADSPRRWASNDTGNLYES